MDRRKFISGVALTSAGLAAGAAAQNESSSKQSKIVTEAVGPKKAVIISKNTGMQGSDGAYELLRRGHDTLDAVLWVLRAQEDDPNDDSVGLGGLPNEDGEVELDACVMHGPTRRGGSVGGVRNIKNVSAVARLVMERTNHVMLVGEGAQKFAVAHGFPKENLLTEHSRKTWLLWKETMSNQDSWGPGISDPNWKPPVPVPHNNAPPSSPQARQQKIDRMYEVAADLGIAPEDRMKAISRVLNPPTGTIHCSVVNEKGEMSGGTTTSGLAWKISGRVGDSPIIGAGCFTDQDVGSAGATGSGEENIKIAGAHTIVENLRKGMSPQEAGMDALRRIARNHNNDMNKLRFLEMVFYVLRKDGAYAGVSLWSHGPTGKPRNFHVNDGTKRLENCAALFQGSAVEWPPILQPAMGK
ncbi:MAG: glycosylasparaginase precursor [Candidatus Angelobacter sp.]|jgi:N4-(beta-N-acetylglucosaminyl)-L-asparaginase|nr:glycosylasparaginase precursor [Candidatus Angelobacter sp.]